MFKILIVEDDSELNKTVCSFLNQSGYEAIGCLNAEDAYDKLVDHVIDLIVSDIMMPEIDGFEFAESVREINEDIPILFMTARDDIASKQRGFRIGVDDYMVKPIDLDELFLRIGALLRRAKIASSRKLEIGVITCSGDYWSTCSRIWNEPYHDRCWRNVRTLWNNSGGFGSRHRNDRCRTCKCGISNL